MSVSYLLYLTKTEFSLGVLHALTPENEGKNTERENTLAPEDNFDIESENII